MTKKEAIEQATRLAKLFPGQVTREHVEQLLKEFGPFAVASVEQAIAEHRRSPDLAGGFWHMGKLLEGCRAAERGKQMEARQSVPDQSFADIYRRQRPDMRDANDYEVIIRVHRAWWRQASRDNPDDPGQRIGSEGYHRQIESSCVNALLSAGGMELAEATRWAEYPFLVEVRDCQHWLDEVRKMTPPAQARKNAEASANIPEFAA